MSEQPPRRRAGDGKLHVRARRLMARGWRAWRTHPGQVISPVAALWLTIISLVLMFALSNISDVSSHADDTATDTATLARSNTRLIRATAALARSNTEVVRATSALATKTERELAKIKRVLCTFKGDLKDRVKQSDSVLRRNPNIAAQFGISQAQLKLSRDNQRKTVHSLRELHC